MDDWFTPTSSVVGLDRVGESGDRIRIITKFAENFVYRNGRGEQFVEIDLSANDVEVMRNKFPAMARLIKVPSKEDVSELILNLGAAVSRYAMFEEMPPVMPQAEHERSLHRLEKNALDARESIVAAFDALRAENDALRAQIQASLRGTPIGAIDRHGNQICIGDRLRFDEREWGGPHEFTIELKDGELQFSGGGKNDFEDWCEIIEPASLTPTLKEPDL